MPFRCFKPLVLGAAAALVLLPGCGSEVPDLGDGATGPSVEDQVMAADRRFAAEVNYAAGADRARVWAGWFAPDGRQLAPGRVVVGREAVLAYMIPAFADTASSLDWAPDQGGGEGTRGWTSGRYASRSAAGVSEGRYLTVWVKVAGEWRVEVDTGVPDPEPVPDSPPAD